VVYGFLNKSGSLAMVAAIRRAEFFLGKPNEQLLISFSETVFVSRALETTNGG
jgi:hypothetical protein